MIRCALLLTLAVALAAPLLVALAGDPGDPPVRLKKKERKDPAPPAAKQKKDKEKQEDLDLEKELKKLEGAKDKVKEGSDEARKKAEEELKELVTRLHKNMQASEDRLGQKDPGDATREIQKDILKDLDELIKQSQSQPDEDAQGQEGSEEKDGQTQGQKNQRKSSSRKKGKSQKQDMAKGGQKQPSGGQKSSPKQGSQQEANNGGKIPGDTTQGATGKDSKGNNRVSDLYKDLWGNYPERQRQDMDTYARERFMPRYEELLRQYYRTISEQGRKTKGD
jgi:hypothetical protein